MFRILRTGYVLNKAVSLFFVALLKLTEATSPAHALPLKTDIIISILYIKFFVGNQYLVSLKVFQQANQ